MKKDLAVLLVISLITFVFWRVAFFNFFAQDDFILINHFSQNNIWQDLKNVLGPPEVTHWRPLHNLYFFIAGNIFGKNYLGYHVLTFLLHIGASFFVYKTSKYFIKNQAAALFSGLFYGLHPANFISLFWISGGATTIGFFFLIVSIYAFLLGKNRLALVFYSLSLLGSEAMIAGLFLFYCLKTVKRRGIIILDKFLITATITSVIFTFVRLLLLTTKTTFDAYPLEFSTKILSAAKYYLLRIVGFAEVSGDYISSGILFAWLLLVTSILFKNYWKKRSPDQLLLSATIIGIGLLPFILIPSHLSPHYMNISIFGFSILVALALKGLKPFMSLAIFLIFMGIAIVNINLTKNNNWVTKRASLAKAYIEQIEKDNPPAGTTLTFADDQRSTSKEAYISLGMGQALSFWFRDKDYKYCFVGLEECP